MNAGKGAGKNQKLAGENESNQGGGGSGAHRNRPLLREKGAGPRLQKKSTHLGRPERANEMVELKRGLTLLGGGTRGKKRREGGETRKVEKPRSSLLRNDVEVTLQFCG